MRSNTAGITAILDLANKKIKKEIRFRISKKGIPNETSPEYLNSSGETHTLP